MIWPITIRSGTAGRSSRAPIAVRQARANPHELKDTSMTPPPTPSAPANSTRQPQRVQGVALYRVEPTRLHGEWTAALPGFDGRTGIEIAERQGGIASGLAGEYHV